MVGLLLALCGTLSLCVSLWIIGPFKTIKFFLIIYIDRWIDRQIRIFTPKVGALDPLIDEYK